MRVVGQRQLRLVAQPALDRLGGRVDLQHQQPAGARPHGALLGLRGVEQLDADRGALVHQRRVGAQRVAAGALLERALQDRQIGRPGGQAGPLDAAAGRRAGQRLGQLRAQALAQLLQVLGLGELPLPVHHPEGDLQVVGDPLLVPRLRRDRQARHPVQHPLQGRQQRLLAVRQLAHRRPGVVRGGHEVAADRLRQRADPGRHQLLAQARDLPVEAVRDHLVEHRERDVHRHAVRIAARLELVRQREAELALLPDVRVVGLGDAVRRVVDQHRLLEVEQVGLVAAGLLPPGVEVPGGDDVLRQAGVVEVEQGLVVHQDVAAAGPVLQLLDLVEQLAVLREEPVVGLPVALHQGGADEQLAAQLGFDPAVVDLPLGDDRQAVQRHLLVGQHRAGLLLPVRLAVGALDQVRGERLHPLRLDLRVDPGPQPGGLHQLGRHHPARRLLEQPRTREHREPGAARARVLALLHVEQAQVGEQAGQQRLVDPVGVRLGVVVRLVDGHAELLGDGAQLDVDVLPLPYPQVVEELGLAHPAERRGGQLLLLLPDVPPHRQVGEEVGGLRVEAAVPLVGGLALLGRAFARVLDGQRGGDHHHVADAAQAVGLQHHAGHPRVDRELGELAAQRGQPLAVVLLGRVERAQLVQQVDAVLDVAGVRRVEERERRDVAEARRGHLQDDGGQVGAEDLRVGELGAGEEVLLRVQPDADAVRGTAAAALALVGAGLADRLDRQPLDLRAVAVAGDPGGARVDHVLDAGDGQRGLGDVGGQHHAALRGALEDPVLLGGGQPGVQRQDLGGLQLQLRQCVRGVADLALAGEEDQDVARALGLELLHRVADRLDLVAVAVQLLLLVGVVVEDRAVADLDRVRPAGDLDDRGVVEVLGEALRVDGGRGDDHLEVGAAGEQLLEVAEQEVDVQAALVRLVDDQGVVLVQVPVGLDLGQQDAVRHQLHQGVLAGLVGEPDLPADGLAERGVQLLGDALGDRAGGDPAGLGVADQAAHAAAQLQADLRDLGGLSGAGLARHDHHLVVADGGQDVVLLLRHRQFLRVADLGNGRAAAGHPQFGTVEVGGQFGQDLLPGLGRPDLAGALQAAAQALRVAQHQAGQPGGQLRERGGGLRGYGRTHCGHPSRLHKGGAGAHLGFCCELPVSQARRADREQPPGTVKGRY